MLNFVFSSVPAIFHFLMLLLLIFSSFSAVLLFFVYVNKLVGLGWRMGRVGPGPWPQTRPTGPAPSRTRYPMANRVNPEVPTWTLS